jgi:hypothetical protein
MGVVGIKAKVASLFPPFAKASFVDKETGQRRYSLFFTCCSTLSQGKEPSLA